jgi:DNA-binding PadR family transcriptional regulator
LNLCATHRDDATRLLIKAIKEVLSCREEALDGLEEFMELERGTIDGLVLNFLLSQVLHYSDISRVNDGSIKLHPEFAILVVASCKLDQGIINANAVWLRALKPDRRVFSRKAGGCQEDDTMRHYSKVDITLMQLIGILPTTGYDLSKALGEVLGFTYKNGGAIARSLAQMERDGLVSSEWQLPEPPRNGAARKIYSLTETGRAYLDEWSRAVIPIGHLNKKGKPRP